MAREINYPEHLFLPENWNGHGPSDPCPSELFPTVRATMDTRKLDERTRSMYYRLASRAIGQYSKNRGSFLPQETFAAGSVFDASSLAPGTIIGIRKEFGAFLDGKPNAHVETTATGVVCQPREGDGIGKAIAYYSQTPIGLLYLNYWYPQIEIGSTHHVKYRTPDLLNYDTLTTIHSIQVLGPR